MQIFVFTLRTFVNPPAIKGMHIRKATKNLKEVILKKQCVHSIVMVELGGMHGPKSRAGISAYEREGQGAQEPIGRTQESKEVFVVSGRREL